MRHVTIDQNGFPTGFYWSEIHGDNIPPDAIPITDEEWLECLAYPGLRQWVDGTLSVCNPPAPTVDDYRAAIQVMIDGVARARRYDSGNSLASYAASTNPQWRAEAQAFIAWRDSVWAFAYAELDHVQSGQREPPSVAQFLTEITPILWPALPAE